MEENSWNYWAKRRANDDRRWNVLCKSSAASEPSKTRGPSQNQRTLFYLDQLLGIICFLCCPMSLRVGFENVKLEWKF